MFPTIDQVMQLARSMVMDTFPGVGGQQGRILTNDAPFTLPFLNDAIDELSRRLRNEGVTFPIKDGVVLGNIPPVVRADPSVFINIGFTGANNGTTTAAVPYLPGDCMQVYKVMQRVTGSNLPFVIMPQAAGGLMSGYQNQWLGQWEWRQYAIYMNGSLQAQDIMIRYLTGQPPLNVPPASFATTPIYIQDSKSALAALMAWHYASARGSNPASIERAEKKADAAIDEMANEYIRRSQAQTFQRQSYQGGGSNVTGDVGLGSVGTQT